MATELTLFSQGGNELPAHLRELAAQDDLTSRLAGGDQGKSISIDGGVWRMIVGGEEIAKNEDRSMQLVVVNAAPHVSRTFYEGKYVKGQAAEPSCYSPDGRNPAPDAPKPQSLACATCPQNVAGSGDGDTRACRFNQRFAVAIANDLKGNVYRLQLPAKSLFGKGEGEKMPMHAYAKFLAGHGVPISGVVTEARFNTAESVPVLTFRAVRPLTREEVEMSRAQGASDDARRAIEFKMYRKAAAPAAPQLAAPAAPAAPAPVEAAAPAAPAPEPTVRRAKPAPAAPVAAVAPTDVASVLDKWASGDE